MGPDNIKPTLSFEPHLGHLKGYYKPKFISQQAENSAEIQ
jgi:hypothetical protein